MEKAQVLIVEDDAIIAMDLESRMKQLGYGVTGIEGYGEKAIEKVKENPPDVVLMDIILKGKIDGIEAADQIRTQFDIPVIFLTAFADKERLERAKLTYPFGFILKPFQNKDLEITIEMALYVAKVDAERKQAEEALRNEKEITETALNSQQDTFFLFESTTGRAIRWNRAFNDITGYSDEQIAGMVTPDSYYSPEDLERTGIIIQDVLETGIGTIELELICKDGRKVPTEYKVSVIKDEKGKPKYFISIGRDVTERKMAEEALRESEERFKRLSDATIEGLAFHEKGLLLDANDRFVKMFGYDSLTEMLDMEINVTELASPKTRGIVRNNAAEGYPEPYEAEGLRKDGSLFPIIIHGRQIPHEGKMVRIAAVRDITEQKKTERALRESEKKLVRSKKMEALGLWAGGVAHDLNNVLSGIVSYPELLLLDLPKDSKLRKPIETIQESGHRAAAIVQDLLTVARGVAIARKPLNLNAIVEDYLLSPEFKKLEQFHSTVTIKTNLDTDLFNISGSDAHLRKVIMNLVSNASEAIEGSGNVIISTMNCYVDRPIRGYDDVTMGEYAVLSVSDDGPGISPDDLERIFEPFYTKKVMGRSGTGLGLAVVWNVVRDLKGYLDVISDENGTTFELYFPITRDEVSDEDLSISIEDFKGDGETVLVVDDVESQRDISCYMLNKLGYKAKAVSSGEEAVEYLTEHTVDLILLDMIMDPGINGRETYEQIIKIQPKQKAVIASGFAETDDVKETQKLGAGQYIKKPLTLEKIGIAVRDELKK